LTDKRRAYLAVIWALLGSTAWLATSAALVALIAASGWFQQHPRFGHAVVWTVAALAGLGGLWGYWNVTWAHAIYSGGYRVRWLGAQNYAYEEFGDDGMFRSFAFGYQPLAKSYAPPCRISLPGAAQWEAGTPAWAHGRRDEILVRLRGWAQRGHGEAVTFVPPGALGEST
jgi:hypothetical protein